MIWVFCHFNFPALNFFYRSFISIHVQKKNRWSEIVKQMKTTRLYFTHLFRPFIIIMYIHRLIALKILYYITRWWFLMAPRPFRGWWGSDSVACKNFVIIFQLSLVPPDEISNWLKKKKIRTSSSSFVLITYT